MVSKEEYHEFINKKILNKISKKNIKMHQLNESSKECGYVIAITGLIFFIIGGSEACSYFNVSSIFSAIFKNITEFFHYQKHHNFTIMIIVGIIAFVLGIKKVVNYVDLENRVSSKYRELILNYLLKGYKHYYNKNKYIKRYRFTSSKFVGEYSNYSGNNYLEVEIPTENEQALKLTMCNIKAEKYRTNPNNKVPFQDEFNVLYDGTFGFIEFPSNFDFFLEINTLSEAGEEVELESMEFNKLFNVRSNDQIKSRMFLTPLVMEKLIEMEKGQGRVMLRTDCNELYIGMRNKLFEKRKINKDLVEYFDDFYDDIYSIIQLVEAIKSNERLFK